MKSTLLIAFLFACSMASFISAATEKAVMSQINRIYKSGSAMTPAKSLYDEDIKYCGTYETECIPVDIISMKQGMKVLGMMHKNPIYVANTISAYVDNKCTDSLMAERLTLNAALKVKNEVTKDVELTVEKVTVLFGMEAAASAITCEEPLKVDTEYDITTIKCKDEEGKDPFADMKEMIGVAQPVSILVETFGTGTVSDEVLEQAVRKTFDLRPTAIIRDLDLQKPIYRSLAAYGHMGREDLGVLWEKTDRAEQLKAACQ